MQTIVVIRFFYSLSSILLTYLPGTYLIVPAEKQNLQPNPLKNKIKPL